MLTRGTLIGSLLVVCATLMLLGILPPAGAQDENTTGEPPTHGVCILVPTRDNEVAGTITFVQQENYVQLQGEVIGLTPGLHGFHIHQYGDLRDPQGKAAGGHYNPEGHEHGGPDDRRRHAGDLGNIEADANGVAIVDIKAEGLKLPSVFGRSIVVHAGEDDLKSQPSGNAGPRVAVGVIGIAKPE